MPCKTATAYAERIMKATSLEELAHLGAEVKADIKSVVGWESWLRDIYTSRYDTIVENNVAKSKKV